VIEAKHEASLLRENKEKIVPLPSDWLAMRWLSAHDAS